MPREVRTAPASRADAWLINGLLTLTAPVRTSSSARYLPPPGLERRLATVSWPGSRRLDSKSVARRLTSEAPVRPSCRLFESERGTAERKAHYFGRLINGTDFFSGGKAKKERTPFLIASRGFFIQNFRRIAAQKNGGDRGHSATFVVSVFLSTIVAPEKQAPRSSDRGCIWRQRGAIWTTASHLARGLSHGHGAPLGLSCLCVSVVRCP